MNKRITTIQSIFGLYEAFCLIMAFYVVVYMLCQCQMLPVSIDRAWDYFSHCARHFHLLAVGLLPVYIALMVFGAAVGGIYLGSILQRWAGQWFCIKS